MTIFIQFFFYINVLNNEKLNIFTFEPAFRYNKTIQSLTFLKDIKNKKHILEIHIINNYYNGFIDELSEIHIVDETFNIDLLIENLNNVNNSFLNSNKNEHFETD